MKKLEPTPAERNRVDVKLARKAHAEWLIASHIHRRVGLQSMDKPHKRPVTKRTACTEKGWSEKMSEFHAHFGRVEPTRKGSPLNLQWRKPGTNTDTFNAFLTQLLQHVQPNEVVTILLDNAPCHRRAEEIIAQHNVSLRYLPAYSPFLIIDENCFSVCKAGLKRQLEEVRNQLLRQAYAEQMTTLTQLVEQNLANITPDMCMSFHRGTRRTFPACIQLHDVLVHG